ncbi:MAG: pyrroloquinoline quinone biosynthesis protein PqqE [Aestuariivirga sp.]
MTVPAPIGLLAELTHRCPLQCAYCSNPVQLDRRQLEMQTADWQRVFSEANDLGVLQVHLSGGEPTARADLEQIIGHCAKLELYTNLITSGVMLNEERLKAIADQGLDHVQLSLQDVDPLNADQIGGFKGGHAKKLALGAAVVKLGLPLTVNAVIHRHNIQNISEMVQLALDMGAKRVEIAHVQYYGWALKNRAHLMPTREQAVAADAEVKALRHKHHGMIVIDSVIPDYFARVPKPCMGGWGARVINVTPSGRVLPCHAAETISGLEFWSVRDRTLADIWSRSPAFNAYRGLDWMEEPCISCDKKTSCKGGCRCQALALAGRATAADPVCELSPFHHVLEVAAQEAAAAALAPRRISVA